ncbi:hypothetical protein [Paucibacter sp. XJ19-41]|uniref:hypothetical protein n=1 Tax=Paucibacter sp. XJ19-41 TaxID=2927824 RepID=UPI00234B7BBB|nr:hypothetical protein [Paucibacter sp. XJ19-41]MDC6170265.1 hypothetical protein [Paucibacter sp. XJ19-41]
MLDQSYIKTEAGRAEIKARALPLSRSTRNLLLVLDGSRSARQWLAMVQGVGEADIAYLIEQGLIAPGAAAAAKPVAAPQAAPAPQTPASEVQLDYQQLYAYLSSQATKQLGLMKGYVFALEVEQCQDLAELQKLALSLVERVQQSKGEAAAAELRQALGLPA